VRRPSRPPFVRQVFAAASTCRHLESVRRFARDREVGHLRLCQRFPAVSVLRRVLTFGRREVAPAFRLTCIPSFSPSLSPCLFYIFARGKGAQRRHAVRDCAARSPWGGGQAPWRVIFVGPVRAEHPRPPRPLSPRRLPWSLRGGGGGGSPGRACLGGSLGWWRKLRRFPALSDAPRLRRCMCHCTGIWSYTQC